MVHQAISSLAAAADPDLVDTCGDPTRWLCEWVYDSTDGNQTVARLADWFIGVPLSVIGILLAAWLLSRIGRRVVRKVVREAIARPPSSMSSLSEAIASSRPSRMAQDVADRIAGEFGRSGRSDDDVDDDADALSAAAERDAATREEIRATYVSRRAARADSIATVVGSTLTVVIWVIALLMVIDEIGVPVGPLIAGAGIGGVALGFGAQSLVKDCISGLFMLVEDQYGIGDVVDLGEASGVVERISLRATVLRGVDGTVWHVPNGEVQRVGNKSQRWSVALVDIDVAYDTDLVEAQRVIGDAAREVCADEEWAPIVLGEPEVLGVEHLGADGITVRTVVRTRPGTQWALQRALRSAYKQALDSSSIEIPFPQRTVWVRSDNAQGLGGESD